ncbi:MAG: UPF0213 protein [Gemmatales bacterium]|nr:MAG: UPF0213 protein [Gemmatales bacterium]
MDSTSASWYVYILKCADGSLYTGATTDLTRRLCEHLAGQASRYTRGRLPVQLVYYEKHPNRSSAFRREAEIKKLDCKSKQILVSEFRIRPAN